MVIRWGDPILPGAPGVRLPPTRPRPRSSASSATTTTSSACCRSAAATGPLLVVQPRVHQRGADVPRLHQPEALTVEQVEIAMAAHGMSVVEIERVGRHRPVAAGRGAAPAVQPADHHAGDAVPVRPARRPARPCCGPPPTRSGVTAIGTLNNCAGGVTPWGTVLSGEENFNQYFVGGDAAPAGAQADAGPLRHLDHGPLPSRLAQVGTGAGAVRPGQAPERGATGSAGSSRSTRTTRTSTPRKHTAMGRFKHEGANVIVARRRPRRRVHGRRRAVRLPVQVRLRQEVLPGNAATARHNLTLLESGTLYVAKFTGDSPPAEIDGTGKLPVGRRVRRHRPVDHAGRRRPVVRARHDRREVLDLHPAGR